MARLNTHLSATPQQTRSSTVDSLYRDPSLAPRNESNARTSSYSVMSPSASMNSDKENEQPKTRENTPQPSKRRGLRGASARIPTPDTGSTTGTNGSKRRRTGEYNMRGSRGPEIHEDGPDDGDEGAEPEDEDEDNPTAPEEDEQGDLRFYNPNQDPEQRRRLRATLRDHSRVVDENKDEMIKPNRLLLDALKKQDNLFGKVRQTADAALDSRFLVNASELAGKKLNNSLQGNAGVGIDLDQFVSKCIYFMKSGGRIAGEEDAPALPVADEDDEAGDDGLDWALLGRYACFPCNRRPPTSSFLLGPLSVQKRARATQRRARSQRQPVGPATRPQEIKEGDIQQNENSNLSNLVKSINTRLRDHIEKVDGLVANELSEIPEDEIEPEDLAAASKRYRAAITPSEELAVSLLDFAINPHDFGQTVENLFYISFLVREGNAKILKDDDGLPLLMPAKAHEISEQRENNVQKNQAVLSIDYQTWQMFIKAFDIEEPLIPHREEEEANVAPGGWYAG
ncbi:Nse4-domain-containing protein [Setomelanomma holmii]|uniref:Non-structural maintenance of chromosomes element 4 n=1 Tax=Setomelanomma holmii TaxID=210430 RepID=A0A9P4LKH0_9PLEO|nr:Nse4-domain-containing protein [Setomelanomma holmii]